MLEIRRNGISCSACPKLDAYEDTRDEELFKEQCSPKQCVLNAYNASDLKELWTFFIRLIGWQSAGMNRQAEDAMRGMSIVHLDAFAVFKAIYEIDRRE